MNTYKIKNDKEKYIPTLKTIFWFLWHQHHTEM